jgi:HSP20 family molecular chaperone IbpA
LEVPGFKKEDITIYRQNALTIVKGIKNKPYKV